MDQHPEESSSNYRAHSDELQLVVLTQQKRHLMTEISPFDMKTISKPRRIKYIIKHSKKTKNTLICNRTTTIFFFTREGITQLTNCFSLIFNRNLRKTTHKYLDLIYL